MLRRFIGWTLRLAGHRHALAWLAVISFVESSILPVSPDLLIIPMAYAQPRKAWAIAAAATLGSLAGGLVGYAIGHFLFQAVGEPLIHFYGAEASYERFRALYHEWGIWIVALGGFTPMLYKVVTIASGAVGLNIAAFAVTLALSRALHFALVAGPVAYFGAPAKRFLEQNLMLVAMILLALLLGGLLAFRYVS